MVNSVIRRATFMDAALLAELGARTFAETFAADNTPANMAAYLAASFNPTQQSVELSDARATFLIAEIDGVASGYAMLRVGPVTEAITGDNPIELVRLYVSQDAIGTGVGAALMKECLSESKRLGHETIWLGVWERNHRAQEFYRKWGFVEVGTHVFELGDDRQTDLLMQRLLLH